jgi:DNA polymerase I-like protein with 3'-5' exonuclease and polymerase domains
MLVGFDTEFTYRTGRWLGGAYHGDVTTFDPVCACLVFEDGREVRVMGGWAELRPVLEGHDYTFVVHGCHAESLFCERVRLPFPTSFLDTQLMSVMLLHAQSHDHGASVYYHAALARMAARYGVPHPSADDKDAIRESILRGTYREAFGMERVLDYCRDDARACLRLVGPLRASFLATCGPSAMTNLTEFYQPYALAMARLAGRGLRFDVQGWGRVLELAPRYRGRMTAEMRRAGYDHDGAGLGHQGFRRMICHLGLERTWPRTPTGMLSTRQDDLKPFRDIPAVNAAYDLAKFDTFMGQDIGSRVDADGRLRCSVLPLAQRTGRNSTVTPNLMGIPAELRPLLLPDVGCKLIHFDFAQQEPGIAGHLSGDEALLRDFAGGDVYRSLGLRMGLLSDDMSQEEVRNLRNRVLKQLMLSIIYGKGATGIARDIPCSLHEAKLHLHHFASTYPRLVDWLRHYVAVGLERGWAENVIGYRAAFDVTNPGSRGHIARSCQNFPIQASAAACFQLTGLHLADFGADLRLPLHDAYLINVPDEPEALQEVRAQIESAATAATNQLFPGLAVRIDVEELGCFAKDGNQTSFEEWLAHLEEYEPCVAI